MGSSLTTTPLPLDELPIPKAEERPIQYIPPPVQQMPAGAGYMGNTGQVAAIASQFLNGWMQGRAVNEAKKIQMAEGEVKGAQAGYRLAAENYKNLRESGGDPNDPEFAKRLNEAKAAAEYQFNNFKTVVRNYSGLDEQGQEKKKGFGGRLKDAFVAPEPAFGYAKVAFNFLQQFKGTEDALLGTPDPVAMAEKKNRAKLVHGQTAQLDAVDEITNLRKQYPDISKAPPEIQAKYGEANSRLTAEIDRQHLLKTGRPYSGSPEQVRESILADIIAGKELTPQQREIAIAMGIVRDRMPSVSMVPNADGTTAIVTVSPEGKQISTAIVTGPDGKPLRGRIPEDAAAAAVRTINAQYEAQVKIFMKAGLSEQEARQRAAGIQVNPKLDALKEQQTLDTAISRTLAELKREDPNLAKAVENNFVTGANGQWFLNSTLGVVNKPLWGETTYGGVKESDLKNIDQKFRAHLRTTLRTMGMPEEQVSRILTANPSPVAAVDRQVGEPGAPLQSPSTGGSQAQTQRYRIVGKDGTFEENLTKARADEMKAMGANISLVPAAENAYRVGGRQ